MKKVKPSKEICTCYDHLEESCFTAKLVDGHYIHPGCGKEFIPKKLRGDK